MGCHSLLQGIFPTQGSNLRLLCLLALAGGFLPLSPLRSPTEATAFLYALGQGTKISESSLHLSPFICASGYGNILLLMWTLQGNRREGEESECEALC